MATLTLNPSRDAVLSEGFSSINTGGDTSQVAGKTALGVRYHPIFTFDASALPGGATVTSVVLKLYVTAATTAAGSRTLSFRRVKRTSWVEGTSLGDGATWDTYDADGLLFWSTAGALGANDYDSGLEVVGTMPTATGAYWSTAGFDAILADATASRSNLVHIVGHATGASDERITFNLRESGSNKPELVITYTVPVSSAGSQMLLLGDE